MGCVTKVMMSLNKLFCQRVFLEVEIPRGSRPLPNSLSCFEYTEREAARKVKTSRDDYNLVRTLVKVATG